MFISDMPPKEKKVLFETWLNEMKLVVSEIYEYEKWDMRILMKRFGLYGLEESDAPNIFFWLIDPIFPKERIKELSIDASIEKTTLDVLEKIKFDYRENRQ